MPPEPRVIIRQPPPGAAAGIDEDMIRIVVHAFYDRIRADEILAPKFEAFITDWEPHLQKMCDFWSSVLLMTRRYDGRPVPAHIKIDGLDHTHFAHWLGLFRGVVSQICPPDAAAIFIDRAERIAKSLQLSIDWKNGVLPPLQAPIRSSKAT